MKKLPLMIVDDSMIIRQIITEAHNKDKYSLVATAKDGEEAVIKFIEFKPRVVTMDLTMPKLDGINCIEELISIDPSVQIVVVSALSDEETGLTAIEKGAAGFVNKPFTEEQICSAIDIIAEDIIHG